MLQSLAPIIAQYDVQQVLLLVDSNVLSAIITEQMPYPTLQFDVDAHCKNITSVERIWDFLHAHHATRHSLLIIIGGGTLSDIGGFAAATYLRGINYVNIPTTLLAMVDASIGGKTGVDYAGLKNYIGAFHLPVAVIQEPRFLATLSRPQWLSGCGEILKTWLLGALPFTSNDIVSLLEQSSEAPISAIVRACARYKENIVAQDPTESGLRKVLNLGHTVGHALEEQANGKMEHGYAVVYGLIAALYLSITKLGFPREPLTQLTHWMITYYGRPQCNCKQVAELIEKMHADKKNKSSEQVFFTLLQNPGHPLYDQYVSNEEIEEAVDYLFSL